MLRTIFLILDLKDIILDDNLDESEKIERIDFLLESVPISRLIQAFFINSFEIDFVFFYQNLQRKNLHTKSYSEIVNLSLDEILNEDPPLETLISRYKNLPLLHSIILTNQTGLINSFFEKIHNFYKIYDKSNASSILVSILDFPDPRYGTGLNQAIREQKIEMVTEILSHNIDPNKRDCHGHVPLWFAVTHSYVEICRKLLESKADLEIEDDQGNNIWHVVAKSGNMQILNLLLQFEQNLPLSIKQQNSEGMTALDVALDNNHLEIFEKLSLSANINSNNSLNYNLITLLESVNINEATAPSSTVRGFMRQNNSKKI